MVKYFNFGANILKLDNTAQPLHYAFVNISKAFEDTITTKNGMQFYIDTRFDKSHHVTTTGTIDALPISCKGAVKRIAKQLKKGDEVAFSYRVCADIDHIVTDGYFTEVTDEKSNLFKRWENGKGEKIVMVAMPTSTNGIMWAGTYVDKYGELVSGEQGSESRVLNWLSQFSFQNADKFKFKNLIPIGNKDVWKVRIDEIFAKKTQDGLVAVGERLLLKPIDIDIKNRLEIMNGIIIPEKSVMMRFYDRATLQHDYAPLGLKKGDIVSFEEKFVEKYEFYGEEYFLLKTSRCLGKWEQSISS